MKASILCLALAFAATAGAHELDNNLSTTSEQAAASLPKTTVIRVNNQTKEVEVVHLTTRLEKNQKIENVKFEKSAVNTEIAGIKFDASNELDATSSTSSWRSGGFIARGPRGGVVAGGYYRGGYYGGYNPNYGYGYNNGYYGNGYYGNGYYNGGYSGYGYYNPYYYNNSYYTVNSGCYDNYDYGYDCGSGYYARYRVANYAYVARPYYYYSTPSYSYYYCGQPVLY